MIVFQSILMIYVDTYSASLILRSIDLTTSISSRQGSYPLLAFFFSATFLLAIPYSLLS